MAAAGKFTQEQMSDLVDSNMFDVKILSTLEEYAQQQAQTGSYDFYANRHLLKLYLMYPDTINIHRLGQVLLTSLMRLPSTDFKCCIHMIPEKIAEQEPVKTIVKLGELLETAQFKRFWKEADAQRNLLASVKDFTPAVQEFIAVTVSATFQAAPTALLKELLDFVDPGTFNAFVEAHGWTRSDDGRNVEFPVTDDNQGAKAVTTEKIGLDQLSKLMGVLSQQQ